MTKWTLAGATLSAVLTMVGCAGGAPEAGDEGDEESSLASIKLRLVADSTFEGRSVVICGTRQLTEVKYPCKSILPCTCFSLDGGEATAEIANLCPSRNLPPAEWTFSYTFYTGSCSEGRPTGEALNPLDVLNEPAGFVCYDWDNLARLESPNRSVERLEVGCNENRLVCFSRSAPGSN